MPRRELPAFYAYLPPFAVKVVEVKQDLRVLAVQLGRAALYALMVSLPPLLAWLDVHWLHDGIGEWSLVELSQEGFLLASALAFVRLARRRADERRFALLAAALFGCMFLREMDELLDLVVHGFWKYPAAALAASAIVYGLRDLPASIGGLVRLLGARAGTVMLVGLVVLLVYSRLLGMGPLWNGLLGEQYLRVFKNAIEETTELLGYTFILAASLGYAAQRIREPARAARAATPLQGGAVGRR